MDRGQALTSWRAEDTVYWQQVQNGGIEGRHSLPKQQRTWCVSKCKMKSRHSQTREQRTCSVSRHNMEGQRAGTHLLERRGHGVLAGSKQRDQGQPLTSWRAEDMVCQETQTKGLRAGTHILKSRGHGQYLQKKAMKILNFLCRCSEQEQLQLGDFERGCARAIWPCLALSVTSSFTHTVGYKTGSGNLW